MLGAGLFAANLSTTFRLRKFGMADGATYPVQYSLAPPAGADAAAPAYQPKALLPFMKRLPAKRVVHLPDGAADPARFSLAFNASGHPLPPGVGGPELAEYELTGAQYRAGLPYPIPSTRWQVRRARSGAPSAVQRRGGGAGRRPAVRLRAWAAPGAARGAAARWQ